MAKLPRDLSGDEVVRGLRRVGYAVVRQQGSHVRMTTTVGGENHATIPMHNPIRSGMLSKILGDVAAHLGINRDELLRRMKV